MPPAPRTTVAVPSHRVPSLSVQPPVMVAVVPLSVVAGQAASLKVKSPVAKPIGSYTPLNAPNALDAFAQPATFLSLASGSDLQAASTTISDRQMVRMLG